MKDLFINAGLLSQAENLAPGRVIKYKNTEPAQVSASNYPSVHNPELVSITNLVRVSKVNAKPLPVPAPRRT